MSLCWQLFSLSIVVDRLEALNGFIEKLFEPASYPEPSLTEPLEVPEDIGASYKTVMAKYMTNDGTPVYL